MKLKITILPFKHIICKLDYVMMLNDVEGSIDMVNKRLFNRYVCFFLHA